MYTIADADLTADRESILRLWADNFLHATEDRYEWIYTRQALGEPACLLLKDAADSTVGLNALLCRRVLFKGEERVVGQAVDLAIDREHRAAGPAVRLQKSVLARAADEGVHVVYGFPMPAAEAVLKRVGYRHLGPFRHWVKWVNHRRVDEGASMAVRRFCRVAEGRMREAVHRLPRGWHVEEYAGFDSRFEGFWRRASAQFDVLGERGPGFLKGRFFGSPKGDYRVFCMADDRDRLRGYVVWDLRKKGVAKIVDALAGTPKEWPGLIAAFSSQVRREGVEKVEFPLLAPPWLNESLRRLGFMQRKGGERSNNNVMLHSGKASNVTGHESWFLTHADSDAD